LRRGRRRRGRPSGTGAAALLSSLPAAEWLIADRGYDADWFREALKDKGIRPCIPGRKSRGKPINHDKRRYKRRNRIEILFGRLKDWRRVATRYDRCAKTFLSAVALAAAAMFWLWRSMSLDPGGRRNYILRWVCKAK
jgi:transposase